MPAAPNRQPPRRVPLAFLTVSSNADASNPDLIRVNVSLTEQRGKEIYSRSYICTIDETDYVTFPNDLTARIQTLLTAVCLCQKYPNTYEGDSRAELGEQPILRQR